MAAGDRGSRGRGEYGRGRANDSFGGGGDNRDRRSFGSIGRGPSYGMSEKDFSETIGRGSGDRGNGGGGDRPASTGTGGGGSDVGSASAPEEGRRPQYGRYSTPSPIGPAASYGLDPETYENIAEPHQPASPDRYESWARDVLARDEAGQAPSAREQERLQSGLSGYQSRRAVDALSGVVGLGNPALSAGIQAANYLGSKFASPEFQAGQSLAGQSTTSGTLGGLASQVAGALGQPGIAQAADVAGTFGSEYEKSTSPTGQLFGDIGRRLGGQERANKAFNGGRGGRDGDKDYTYGSNITDVVPQAPQSLGFQAADPFYYSTFLDKFTAG